MADQNKLERLFLLRPTFIDGEKKSLSTKTWSQFYKTFMYVADGLGK
jgi:hypothetical protein